MRSVEGFFLAELAAYVAAGWLRTLSLCGFVMLGLQLAQHAVRLFHIGLDPGSDIPIAVVAALVDHGALDRDLFHGIPVDAQDK